ncbi:MAG: hypothetical protein Q9208_006972 [Pyrenodesmia sp. 3 TL-2023]
MRPLILPTEESGLQEQPPPLLRRTPLPTSQYQNSPPYLELPIPERPHPYLPSPAPGTMPKSSRTKRIGRPLPYARPSTMVSTPPATQAPQHQANELSNTNTSNTNPSDPNPSNTDPPDTDPSNTNPSNTNPLPTHALQQPSPTTTTTTPTPALPSPNPSPGKVQPPDYTTWHPIPVLHTFNLLVSQPVMPPTHPMVQELHQDPLPPLLALENDLRILVLDDWWKEQIRRTLPLEPLHREKRTG